LTEFKISSRNKRGIIFNTNQRFFAILSIGNIAVLTGPKGLLRLLKSLTGIIMRAQTTKTLSLFISLFFFVSFSLNAKEFGIYISPKGNDNHPGTQTAPLKSLEKAREMIRLIRKESHEATFVVYIGGGTYPTENPVVFTSEDSGNEKAPVIYKAVEGEKPVFTGSKELKNWQLLTNSEKLKILSPEVKGKIYVTDIKTAGISDFGDPTDIGKRPELFCNGQLQTLARWPNSGFTKAGLAKGKTDLPATYIKNHGTVEGVFEYTDKREDRWASEKDVRLGGYWYWDWSDEFQKVDKVDHDARLLYLKTPYHQYGYKDSLRYFGLNLFCELDQPGEWYLDRTDGLLYWYPPKGVDPSKAAINLSVFSSPFMVELKNCSFLTLKGLTFQEGRGSAILIDKGKNCLISDCLVERFGCDGIHIVEGSGDGISGCYLRTFGCGGIQIKGGDRKNLIPANHFVEHTVVEDFSLFKRTYEPAVHLDGCSIRLTNNLFRNSSSSAMRLEGNDCLIEYNQISKVVNESDDQGGIDMFYNPSYQGNIIRYNHWSDIAGGTRHGAAGVRLDDMISGVTIYGNVFEKCGVLNFGAVQIHGGKDNLVENNLFYKCLAAISCSAWGEDRWLKTLDSPVIQKKLYEEVDINSPIYRKKYPQLKDIRSNPNRNTVINNLLVDCDHQVLRKNSALILLNNDSITSNGKKIEEFCNRKLLKEHGLKAIPYHEMGPKKNPWIHETHLSDL